ncbi:hypothetical protein BJ741DRAFT_632108 [Chytriomyces cf. hyalinus JEL632]|nr:hypothetical protein BJ741DRAFT_632108 [Chytriomyces cf. hyalinus JEL632]
MACVLSLCQHNTQFLTSGPCMCVGSTATESAICGRGAVCTSLGECQCRDATLGDGFTCNTPSKAHCTGQGAVTSQAEGFSADYKTCGTGSPSGNKCSATRQKCYLDSHHVSSISSNDQTIGAFKTCLRTCSNDQEGPCYCEPLRKGVNASQTCTSPTTTSTSTSTTIQTRVYGIPNAPKYPKAAPKKLSKHYCEQVYAHSDLFSDSKYDGLWNAVDDPAQTFRDIAGKVLVEEFEYQAFKKYTAKLKQCLDQSEDVHRHRRKAVE